eukprot:1894028-Rhodomonas_salina.2
MSSVVVRVWKLRIPPLTGAAAPCGADTAVVILVTRHSAVLVAAALYITVVPFDILVCRVAPRVAFPVWVAAVVAVQLRVLGRRESMLVRRLRIPALTR